MKNKKSNKYLVAFLVVFVIVSLGLSGYILYNKINDKAVDNKYNYNLTKRTNIQSISEGYINIIVDTEGNTYLSLIGNFYYSDDEELKNNLTSIQDKFDNYSPKNYYDNNGENQIKAYKLDVEKVLTAYYVHMGNSGDSYFVFVKENGTLSYLSYDNLVHNSEINLKNINNLQNIVSVVENTYTMTPYAIDSDGMEIDLYDYIK